MTVPVFRVAIIPSKDNGKGLFMKKFHNFFILLSITLLLSGCSYVGHKPSHELSQAEYCDDIDMYWFASELSEIVDRIQKFWLESPKYSIDAQCRFRLKISVSGSAEITRAERCNRPNLE